MHQSAGGVVNVDEQGALRSAALEPPVLRPVNLDQLAKTVPPVPRLVNSLQSRSAVLPKSGRDHPLPQRLAPKVNAVQLRQLLGRQRRAEVRVTLPDDAKDFGAPGARIAAVARPASSARHQGFRTVPCKGLAKPEYLTPAKTHQRRGVRNLDPACSQILQHAHPVDLRPAHRNHRHRPNTPQPKPWRVTSQSGPMVTSLSGVYSVHSQIDCYGTCRIRWRRSVDSARTSR